MEWKHRKKSTYLATEANWVIRCSHAMQDMGFVFKECLLLFQCVMGWKKDLANSRSHHWPARHILLWGAWVRFKTRALRQHPQRFLFDSSSVEPKHWPNKWACRWHCFCGWGHPTPGYCVFSNQWDGSLISKTFSWQQREHLLISWTEEFKALLPALTPPQTQWP